MDKWTDWLGLGNARSTLTNPSCRETAHQLFYIFQHCWCYKAASWYHSWNNDTLTHVFNAPQSKFISICYLLVSTVATWCTWEWGDNTLCLGEAFKKVICIYTHWHVYIYTPPLQKKIPIKKQATIWDSLNQMHFLKASHIGSRASAISRAHCLQSRLLACLGHLT